VKSSKLQQPNREAPNPKIQAPEKLQAPSLKLNTLKFGIWLLKLGASLDLGAWDLELFSAAKATN
jgi:hypothetical protein